MARSTTSKKHSAGGTIDVLPSGALRVRVEGGTDALTKRRHRPTQIIQPGPDAEKQANDALIRMLNEVNEDRHPKTNATVNQMLDRYFLRLRCAELTRRTIVRHAENHIRPQIGEHKAARVDADVLDSLYAELARCRVHCTTRFIEHRTTRAHTCNKRCRLHVCKPLGDWTIRKIHFLLSGAYERAKKWTWVSSNPCDLATPPPAPTPDPQPPSPDEAARILNEAWKDLLFGLLVWLMMITGPRRGEICGLRWKHFEAARARLVYHRSIAQDGTEMWDKDTKTHQRRNIALDLQTVALLSDFKKHCERLAALAGTEITPESFIFSLDVDGSSPLKPATLTQRYRRLVARLGIRTTLKSLRHYSATELIAAGVDIRTVAGRLGHSGGGTTTLRVYAAWVAEADQRASTTLLACLPKMPEALADPIERAKTKPEAPYEKIAAGIRQEILDGFTPPDGFAPSIKELTLTHAVSVGTAHRVHGLLRAWGLISEGGRGRRPTIILPATPDVEPLAVTPAAAPIPANGEVLLDLRLVVLGEEVKKLSASADPTDPGHLRRLLQAAARRHGGKDTDLDDYELEVRQFGSSDLITTFAAL